MRLALDGYNEGVDGRTPEMVKTVNAQMARQRFGRLLDDVHRSGVQYVIERAGQPIAAIVPVWLLEERLARKKSSSITSRKSGNETGMYHPK